MPARLPALLAAGSLSASTGLLSGLALAVATLGRRADRLGRVFLLVVGVNLPWLVSGALHAASARSGAVGADVFAPGPDGVIPAPISFLTLGGMWNAEVVPAGPRVRHRASTPPSGPDGNARCVGTGTPAAR